ncbi:unnamed protein product [Polarella glacialis]|uniref:Uncharacterized protein n=1 Tax=Polarella glacialis TaxID=89957 RepID=A0A813IK83_POLGL|nr:unnamed protein product [Polarella glacialis]
MYIQIDIIYIYSVAVLAQASSSLRAGAHLILESFHFAIGGLSAAISRAIMARLSCIAAHVVSLILAVRAATEGEAGGRSVSIALSAAETSHEGQVSDLGLQMDAQISKGIAVGLGPQIAASVHAHSAETGRQSANKAAVVSIPLTETTGDLVAGLGPQVGAFVHRHPTAAQIGLGPQIGVEIRPGHRLRASMVSPGSSWLSFVAQIQDHDCLARLVVGFASVLILFGVLEHEAAKQGKTTSAKRFFNVLVRRRAADAKA